MTGTKDEDALVLLVLGEYPWRTARDLVPHLRERGWPGADRHALSSCLSRLEAQGLARRRLDTPPRWALPASEAGLPPGGAPTEALSPLFKAAVQAGALDLVRTHIRQGANVNAVDARGRTPLMLAAAKGNAELCRLLLEAGANAGVRDHEGRDAQELARGDAAQLLAREPTHERDIQATGEAYPARPAGAGTVHEVGPREIAISQPGESVDIAQASKDGAPENPSDPVTAWLSQGGHTAGSLQRPSTYDSQPAPLAPTAAGLADTADEDKPPFPDDEFLSAWEAESESEPPVDDPALADRARVLQEQIAFHVPHDAASGWTEVEIDLPDLDETRGQALARGSREEDHVRALLLDAVRLGVVSAQAIQTATGTSRDLQAEPATEGDIDALQPDRLELALERVLGELGVTVGDDPWAAELLRARSADRTVGDELAEPEDETEELVQDALDYLRSILNTPQYPVLQYRRDMAAALPVSSDAEAVLGAAIAEGRGTLDSGALARATEARNTLAERHLRFAAWQASQRGGTADLADRIQAANLGLLEAAERFDHTNGARFISYAVWWIRRHLTDEVDKERTLIHMPQHRAQLLQQFQHYRAEAQEQGDAPPHDADYARALNLALDTVKEIRWCLERVPLDDSIADPNPSPDEQFLNRLRDRTVAKKVDSLAEAESTVIRMRFGIGFDQEHTLEEIGQRLGLSRERIRQIEARALEILRRSRQMQALRMMLC